MERMDILNALADEVHADQPYNGKTYRVGHLEEVAAVLAWAGMDTASDRAIAVSHDLIEDAGERRDEVVGILTEQLDEFEFRMVSALTGLGANRRERVADMLRKIIAEPKAADYKVADRIVNWESAKRNGSSLSDMYAREDRLHFYDVVVERATNAMLVERYRKVAGR